MGGIAREATETMHTGVVGQRQGCTAQHRLQACEELMRIERLRRSIAMPLELGLVIQQQRLNEPGHCDGVVRGGCESAKLDLSER